MARLRDLYLSPRVLVMAPLGFSSGLPLLLSGSTLSAWARDEGVTLTKIGILSSISTIYALKFLWAPLLDRYALPLLDRRRGWLLIFQVFLMGAISLMALVGPSGHLLIFGMLAVAVALFSASQDIVADAYRIDILEDAQRGSGAGLFVGGYRLGMIVAGGLAFFIADHLSWQAAYSVMGLAMVIGIIATLLAPSISVASSDREAPVEDQRSPAAPATLKDAIIPPLRQLLLRRGAVAMLLFVLLFKLPDVLGNSFSVAYLIDAGVSKTDIGFIRNTFGLGLTIVGALAGAAIVAKLRLKPSLWLFGFLQAASNAGYLLLTHYGPGKALLLGVISVENFCGGLVTAGFSIYLMAQCDRRYSAFQFALLTSVMALANFTLAPAGYVADHVGWPIFFALTIAAAIPGMAILPWLRCDEQQSR